MGEMMNFRLFPTGADTGVNYLSWIVFALPLMIVCLMLCWLILLAYFLRDCPPADDSVKRAMRQKYHSLPSMRLIRIQLQAINVLRLQLCGKIGSSVFPSSSGHVDHSRSEIRSWLWRAIPTEVRQTVAFLSKRII